MSTLSVHRLENVQDFDMANTPFTTAFNAANGAYAATNAAFNTTNTAYNFANTVNTFAYGVAVNAAAAFAAANNVAPQVTPAFLTGNLAYATANAAFAAGNAEYAFANTVYAAVNSSFATINSAYTFSNSAYASINSNWSVTNALYSVANSAYGLANTKFSSSGGTISGAVEITADLTVHGNTRFVDQQTLSVGDPLIYLAANNYASDVVDIGFVANYVNATSSNVHTGLFRSSGTKEYYLFQGYDREPLNNYIDPTGNNITMAVLNSTVRTSNLILGGANAVNWISSNYITTNAAYASINSNWTVTNTAYSVSNAAFGLANTALQNTSSLFAGNLSIKNGYLIRPLYTSDNSYSATFGWAWLQLGNNAWNDFVAGNSVGGGYFRWYVNNTADMTSAGVSNGTLAMVLDSTGNLGINTSPTSSRKLHVLDGSLRVKMEGTNNNGYCALDMTSKDGSGVASNFYVGMGITRASSYQIYDNTNGHEAYAYINGASGYHLFATAGTERMRITNTGVGIGVTPSYSLDLYNKTDGIRLPSGTTAQRPTGAAGVIRHNTTTGYIEYWDTATSTWLGIGQFFATGGTETTYSSGGSNYKVHTFTSSGTLTVTSGAKSVSVLLVAGGGGTGYDVGGGGGAGGIVATSVTLSPGNYSITIGAGAGSGQSASVPGSDGGNTTGFGLTAIGGGGGGAYPSNGTGHNGGSGGGGGGGPAGSPGGSGTAGQGSPGGACAASPWGSGGGGGASGPGQTGVVGTMVAGGIPYNSSINGTSTNYAGGGYGNADSGSIYLTGYNMSNSYLGTYGYGANGTGTPNNSPYGGNGGVVIVAYQVS